MKFLADMGISLRTVFKPLNLLILELGAILPLIIE